MFILKTTITYLNCSAFSKSFSHVLRYFSLSLGFQEEKNLLKFCSEKFRRNAGRREKMENEILKKLVKNKKQSQKHQSK